ncbi:MAG: diguanylate cyclase [Steroidobacteraceae bacterium]
MPKPRLAPRLAPHFALLFAGAIGLLILVAVFGYRSTLQAERQRQWVLHTYEVIELLVNLVSDLKDVQAAQRGYVITGQDDYLAPYQIALPRIIAARTALEGKVADNSEQRKRLAEVLSEADQRVQLAAMIIATYQEQGEAAAVALVRTGNGNREMEHIRSLVTDMVAIEHRLLDERHRRAEDAAHRTALIGLLGLLICASALSAVFLFIRQENRLRQGAQRSLEASLDTQQRMAQDAQAISQLGEYLRSSRRLNEAYEICSQALPHILPEGSGAIAVFDEQHAELQVVAHWGAHPTLTVGQTFDPEGCWALRRGQIHRSSPYGGAPVCAHPLPDFDGSVCLPMQAHGETLGIFVADAKGLDAEGGVQRLDRIVEQVSLGIASLRIQQRIWEQSVRDPMTDLFNRRYAEPTLQRELARAQRAGGALTVLLLDVDHFKRVNDEYGHDGGDAVLKQVAAMIRTAARSEDVPCRYGGEEFLVVLPGCTLEQGEAWAERLRARLAATRLKISGDRQIPVTASIGVATYPDHADTGPGLISAADGALYAAKASGRNRVLTASSDSALLQEGGTARLRKLEHTG